MLVLSRKINESLTISPNIKVTFLGLCSRGRARLAVEAPREVKVMRTELVNKNEKEFDRARN